MSLPSGEVVTPHDPAGQGLTEPDFRLLFEQSPDNLLVLLPDAPRYTMVAATEARLAATHTTREILGRGLFEQFPDNPDDVRADGTSNLRASLDRVCRTRRADTMPVQKYDIPGADGRFTTRYWSPKNLPVLAADGQLLYILHRVEEVTELMRASAADEERRDSMQRDVIRRSEELAIALRELREANTRLAEVDAAKTEFFSNISHEFRTPLTLMLGPLEEALAADTRLPQEQRQQLEVAHRNALRLLKLVNSLLDFSRIEAGRSTANYEATNLAALTAELASGFQSAVSRAGLSLQVDCPPLPEPVYVDPDMWEKVVLNLLSNAFKHTFEGSISVQLRLAGEYIELIVADTGVGIPSAEIPHLFERFHRVKGTNSRTHEGTGIGLSLVQELVHLHGGHLRVESEPGRGSRFIVCLKPGRSHLPAAQVGEPSALRRDLLNAHVQQALQWMPQDILQAPADEAAPANAGEARARILWADDNEDMRAYVARLLSAEYDVTAVPDGKAALDAALASPPDLVLSDVMMPRLDGPGLLKALRADDRTRRLPVILLSARAGEEASLEGLGAGADDYLVKPFSARELLARIRTHVALARERREWEGRLEHKVRERTAELDASTAALEEENARRRHIERGLQSQLERLNLLDHITRAIAERQDLRSIFQVVNRSVEENLPADTCWIGLMGPDTEGVELRPELIYEADLQAGPVPLPPALAEAGLRACVFAPLQGEEGLIGLMVTGRRAPGSFSSGECEFLRQLSEHVALAVRQTQLHESLWSAYEELRHTQQAVLQQERLSALGQMASGIAHDINNAISPAMLYVEALLETEQAMSPRAKHSLPLILQAIEDVAATVARLREFYRPREMQAAQVPVALNPLLEQIVDLTRARWSDMPQQRGVFVEVLKQPQAGLPAVMGSQSELREALTNLIFNAVDAMPSGGVLTLRTRHESQSVVLEVSDTGVGMDEQTARKCLEPFFSTKGERGTGLGLAMVYGIIKRHGADITIESQPGKGTTFRMVFPAAPDADAAVPRPPVFEARNLRLLLIDDDPLLLRPLRETLELQGHYITTARDGAAGIEAFRNAPADAPFAAVITDLGMPRMDGRAVAKAIKSLSPATPVILLTGWGQRPDAGREVLPHIDHVLGKPPKLQDLRAALAQCCGKRPDVGVA